MKRKSYKDHVVELESQRRRSGGWYSRATVIIDDGKTVKKIPNTESAQDGVRYTTGGRRLRYGTG